MSIKNGKDFLYLIWKSEKSRKQYVVGQLTRNGQYEFRYCKEIKDAIADGFKLLLCFQNGTAYIKMKNYFLSLPVACRIKKEEIRRRFCRNMG